MIERIQVRSRLTGEVVTGTVIGERSNAIVYVGFGDARIWIPGPHPRYSHCEPFMLFTGNRLVRTLERSYEALDWELLQSSYPPDELAAARDRGLPQITTTVEDSGIAMDFHLEPPTPPRRK